MQLRSFLSIRIFSAFMILILGACNTETPTLISATAVKSEPTSSPTVEPTAQVTASTTISETGHNTLTLVWQSEFSPEAAVGAGVDIALDQLGNIYVTTANIKKYNGEGKFLAQWGKVGKGEGEFSLPTGIAVGPQGDVYVNDFSNKRIQKFDSTGNFLSQWAPNPPGSPGSIAVDADGNVYVSLFEAHDHNIQKFDKDGNLLMTWGGPGTEDGQFAGRIEDITLDKDGNLYVTDSYNHRIQKFDSNGNFLAKFGSGPSEEGNGTFTDPEGVAIDWQGNIYVVDNYFLQKLSPTGEFIAQWSRTKGGDLDRAGFLTVDEQGYIYIFARTTVTTATGNFEVLVIKKFSQS
jgi:DNA-binding beta-propeller fold protein YncE